MSHRSPTSPDEFSIVHMNLAREPGHPQGSALDEYVAILPLDAEGRLDKPAWRSSPGLCKVSHLDEDGSSRIGFLSIDADGAWIIRYEDGHEPDRGFRFGAEQFRAGEYVSITRDGKEHTYRVVSVRPVKG